MEDLIKRGDAIKAYNEAMDELVKAQMEEFDLADFSECEFDTTQCKLIARKIESIPAVEPKQEDFNTFIAAAAFGFEVGLSTERPKGEWKDSYDASRFCGIKLKVCSVCGKEYNRDLVKRFNFCPNCGAQVKGIDNE